MSDTTYYVTIISRMRSWEWIVYSDPQRRGMDREVSGTTMTRWGARMAARRWCKRKRKTREQRYEIRVKGGKDA
jgi:hypothetical protein